MKIGFQGDLFSNSEEASLQFSKICGLKIDKFMPLISSKRVVESLLNKEIDYGVLAIQNKIAGIVKETEEALTKKNRTCRYSFTSDSSFSIQKKQKFKNWFCCFTYSSTTPNKRI